MSAPGPPRGRALTIAAVLFALLALSNLSKPLHLSPEQGFVFLGRRLAGTANLIAGWAFGAYLLVYAAGIWGMRRFALPMARLYAAWVVVNLILFTFRSSPPPGAGAGWRLFGLGYAVVAIVVSVGTARLLAERQEDLV